MKVKSLSHYLDSDSDHEEQDMSPNLGKGCFLEALDSSREVESLSPLAGQQASHLVRVGQNIAQNMTCPDP